ncbi:hypothetical protein OHC33_003597 [Knufia fluminis]|uniref:Uncharacterized protein n=2 Tax=Knufia TaxID=430999 RepID=A0AAN8EGA9_9EURO|nr:hypothetical protein OHC33_003597 [Knufia fluminis]
MPALPTSDLRSTSKAYKRSKTQTTKWSRGTRASPGKTCPHTSNNTTSCPDCAARPARNFSAHYFARAERANIHSNNTAHRQGNIAKKVLQNDLHEVAGNGSDTNSSGDEEVVGVNEATVVPAMREQEIMYSYDSRGPSDGADVLSNAVMQAVKRYENKQVEQLVKNEYDLVMDGKDDELEQDYAGDAEDDFELVGYGDLH